MKKLIKRCAMILAVLAFSGCVSMADFNASSHDALLSLMQQCVDTHAPISDIMAIVGPPTVKEKVEDGEIWWWEVRGEQTTQTTGYLGYYGNFASTTTSNVERTVMMFRMDKNGNVYDGSLEGPARGRLRYLRCGKPYWELK